MLGTAEADLVQPIVEAEDSVVGHGLTDHGDNTGGTHGNAAIIGPHRHVLGHLLLHIAEVPAAAHPQGNSRHLLPCPVIAVALAPHRSRSN